MEKENIGYFAIGIFFFFMSLTALTQEDYIYGIGLLFITGIFFSKI